MERSKESSKRREQERSLPYHLLRRRRGFSALRVRDSVGYDAPAINGSRWARAPLAHLK
jgi:hypothetical protein